MKKKTKQKQPSPKKKKQQQKQKSRRSPKPQPANEQSREEKVMRLAHHILTKTIDPANLKLEEVIDILGILAKSIVLSNTEDDDLEDRSEMIAWIEERFVESLAVIDPFDNLDNLDDLDDLDEPAHAWLVSPQGAITEPIGILWSGSHDDMDDVQVVLGADLVALRAEIAGNPADVIVIEGVEGVAVVDPEWDGEPTATCENPQCGKVHDVHLSVAESLFQQAVERRMSPTN